MREWTSVMVIHWALQLLLCELEMWGNPNELAAVITIGLIIVHYVDNCCEGGIDGLRVRILVHFSIRHHRQGHNLA